MNYKLLLVCLASLMSSGVQGAGDHLRKVVESIEHQCTSRSKASALKMLDESLSKPKHRVVAQGIFFASKRLIAVMPYSFVSRPKLLTRSVDEMSSALRIVEQAEVGRMNKEFSADQRMRHVYKILMQIHGEVDRNVIKQFVELVMSRDCPVYKGKTVLEPSTGRVDTHSEKVSAAVAQKQMKRWQTDRQKLALEKRSLKRLYHVQQPASRTMRRRGN